MILITSSLCDLSKYEYHWLDDSARSLNITWWEKKIILTWKCLMLWDLSKLLIFCWQINQYLTRFILFAYYIDDIKRSCKRYIFQLPSFSYMYFLSARLYSGNQKYFLCSKDFLCRFSFHLIQSDVTHYLMKNMRINAESRVWAVYLRYGNFPGLFILLFCIYITDMFIRLDSKDPRIQKYEFLIEV